MTGRHEASDQPAGDSWPIEDYATAWPETAQPTAEEPTDDPGHLVPDDVWATVQADVGAAQ